MNFWHKNSKQDSGFLTFEIEIYGLYGSDIANRNKRENTSGFFDIYLKRILGKLPVGSIEIFVGPAGFLYGYLDDSN